MSDKLIYLAESTDEKEPIRPTIGVKFAQGTFLMRSFLDAHKIPYKEEDLEDSPLGLGIWIKHENR